MMEGTITASIACAKLEYRDCTCTRVAKFELESDELFTPRNLRRPWNAFRPSLLLTNGSATKLIWEHESRSALANWSSPLLEVTLTTAEGKQTSFKWVVAQVTSGLLCGAVGDVTGTFTVTGGVVLLEGRVIEVEGLT